MRPLHSERRGDTLVNLVVVVVVLVLITAVAGFAAGWIRFHSGPDKATIEFETGQMKAAGDQAAEETGRGLRKLEENTERALHNAAHSIHDATAPETNPTPPTLVPVPVAPVEPVPPKPSIQNPAGPPVAPEVIPDIPRR